MSTGSAPSSGGKQIGQDVELNIASIVDCFTVLITYLLAAASFLTVGALDVTVAATDSGAPDQAQLSPQTIISTPSELLVMELTTDHQIHFKGYGSENSNFAVPSTAGKFDYEAATRFVENYKAKHPTLMNVVLSAQNEVSYGDLVEATDAAKKTPSGRSGERRLCMKKTFSKKKKLDGETSLNITAMASIFVVILVFLLKSLSTNVAAVTPTQDLTLPEVKQAPDVADALKLEISADTILVDDHSVLKLDHFQFDSRDLDETGGLKAVSKAIAAEKKNHENSESSERSVVIIADQKTPYATMKRVIASTSSQGYMNLKLMVVKEQ